MRQIKAPETLWAVWVFGILAGVLVPLLLVMGGLLIQLLLEGQQGLARNSSSPLPEQLTVGAFFNLPTVWLNTGGSALRGVLGIVVLVVIVIALECISLLICYRAALHTSLEIAVEVQRKLFEKSGALAIEQGLSGQQEALRDMMFIHVPQARETASQWYRVFPRHLVQSLLLIALACSIQLSVTACSVDLYRRYARENRCMPATDSTTAAHNVASSLKWRLPELSRNRIEITIIKKAASEVPARSIVGDFQTPPSESCN